MIPFHTPTAQQLTNLNQIKRLSDIYKINPVIAGSSPGGGGSIQRTTALLAIGLTALAIRTTIDAVRNKKLPFFQEEEQWEDPERMRDP